MKQLERLRDANKNIKEKEKNIINAINNFKNIEFSAYTGLTIIRDVHNTQRMIS